MQHSSIAPSGSAIFTGPCSMPHCFSNANSKTSFFKAPRLLTAVSLIVPLLRASSLKAIWEVHAHSKIPSGTDALSRIARDQKGSGDTGCLFVPSRIFDVSFVLTVFQPDVSALRLP